MKRRRLAWPEHPRQRLGASAEIFWTATDESSRRGASGWAAPVNSSRRDASRRENRARLSRSRPSPHRQDSAAAARRAETASAVPVTIISTEAGELPCPFVAHNQNSEADRKAYTSEGGVVTAGDCDLRARAPGDNDACEAPRFAATCAALNPTRATSRFKLLAGESGELGAARRRAAVSAPGAASPRRAAQVQGRALRAARGRSSRSFLSSTPPRHAPQTNPASPHMRRETAVARSIPLALPQREGAAPPVCVPPVRIAVRPSRARRAARELFARACVSELMRLAS